MRFETFSPKQLAALSWWCENSRYKNFDAVICDGAVRSGKTICLSLSFVFWSMKSYSDQNFALCGKTIKSLEHNVVIPLLAVLRKEGFACDYKSSKSLVVISYGNKQNRYYLFGGKDKGSAALIQGITLAGVFFDEVALMNRNFVEQALARCSVEGAKQWFNCNPEYPEHWFNCEWILKAKERNALYLHFVMQDNPSLSAKVLERYQKLYSGAFYKRYVLGEWSAVHGAVYPMFSVDDHVVDAIPKCERYVISCDYGIVNPASFGLWGKSGGKWYRIKEYYYDSKVCGLQKTDEEYAEEMDNLAGENKIDAVIIDPSASSFIECIKRRGKYNVVPAKNNVSHGIRLVGGKLKSGNMLIHKCCTDCIREFSLYRWNINAQCDVPVKKNDHAMDDMRYFAMYAFAENETVFFAGSVERKT